MVVQCRCQSTSALHSLRSTLDTHPYHSLIHPLDLLQSYSSIQSGMPECPLCKIPSQDVPRHKKRFYRPVFLALQAVNMMLSVPYERIIGTEPLAFLNCPHVENSQQCRYQHKDFSKIKTHLKEKHNYNSHVTALITLWPDPPAADVIEVDSARAEMDGFDAAEIPQTTRAHTPKSPSQLSESITEINIPSAASASVLPYPPSPFTCLISKPILERYGLRILMPYRCIICIICQHAVAPFGLGDHLKDKHNKQSILREDVEHLKALWVEFKIVRNLKNVPRPPNGGPPLPGIKILSGIACRHCAHIAQEFSSMVTHWYGYHTEDRTPYLDEYLRRPVCLQVLSGSPLRYFEVVLPPAAAAAPPGDLRDMYIDQHGSKFPIHATVNLAPTLNEVPPLQKDTAVMDSLIRDETRHWRPLDDDSNLKKYAASLYHFLLTILRSLDDLLYSMTSNTANSPMSNSSMNSSSHCDIHASWDPGLQDKGQFIELSLATQLFAKVKYQFRGAILHQGIQTMSEHENNPLESVKAVAKQRIHIGTDTPFISIRYYQKYATSLVLSDTQPPTTLVSDDWMNISYKGSTLSITHWRQGFSHALEQTEARLQALLCGLKVNLEMLKNYGDDWSDAQTPGYSWTEHSDLGKLKTILLQHYIRNTDLSFVSDGQLILNPGVTTRILRDIAALTRHICMLEYFLPGGNNRLAEYQDHKLINGTRP
ncbi:hypothetical protein M422DRAFT_273015 [Sphaerobolus stellatus SS14]|uniref:Uncharacterized protein n=1 Tax=Sphaerobolus stellatus (strain SS14) TaxID=990650 RepID=A0A0C9UA83_SPHS4|nr:hypothetical protein M422DRAFT_273015 [Sphaerobolus stellatus SS14]